MRSIQITKSLFLILLTVAYALPALAQSEGRAERDARQLRFASKRPVEHLRLQVHDAAGALIHDSGLVAKSDLVWSLLDSNGAERGSYLHTEAFGKSAKTSVLRAPEKSVER
jgi:hypothetical protein